MNKKNTYLKTTGRNSLQFHMVTCLQSHNEGESISLSRGGWQCAGLCACMIDTAELYRYFMSKSTECQSCWWRINRISHTVITH